MLAGVLGGYGLFAWIGTRFMLPARTGAVTQLFVTGLNDIAVGGTLLYPDARRPNRQHHAARGDRAAPTTSSRSRAPVRTSVARCTGKPQNNRYYCPCHSGTFDPSGKGTGGPPGDAGQSLPRYTLTLQRGLLYIEVPIEQLTMRVAGRRRPSSSAAGAGP